MGRSLDSLIMSILVLSLLASALPTLFFQRYCLMQWGWAHFEAAGVQSFFGPGAFLASLVAAIDDIWDHEGRRLLEELFGSENVNRDIDQHSAELGSQEN